MVLLRYGRSRFLKNALSLADEYGVTKLGILSKKMYESLYPSFLKGIKEKVRESW